MDKLSGNYYCKKFCLHDSVATSQLAHHVVERLMKLFFYVESWSPSTIMCVMGLRFQNDVGDLGWHLHGVDFVFGIMLMFTILTFLVLVGFIYCPI